MDRASQPMPDSSAPGYLHERYARSFCFAAEPRHLPCSKGWVLARSILGTGWSDLIGCYPLFCCRNWTTLARDLDELAADHVSLALVADPFGNHSAASLGSAFDIVREYKNHFVVEPAKFRQKVLERKHRRNVNRALNSVDVEICGRPLDHLDEWCALYALLCRRHSVTGIRALARSAHELQLSVPGLVMFRALAGGQTVGIHLWYQQGEFAYAHLGATNDEGYRSMASYALYWCALEYFFDRVSLIDIGSAPGETVTGLTRFKRGWATSTRTAYFCGRVFDPAKYADLAARSGGHSDFFPAYRRSL